MKQKQWILYGANGYTGRLIAEQAKALGLKPILAGRNQKEIAALGQSLQLPIKIFDCEYENEIAAELNGIDLVLHCAGPFSSTSSLMLSGCMRAKAHYLDITGEIEVFEKIHGRSKEIAESGIVAIPGVGFDVVPSDCLAAMLKESLPDAVELELILKPSGGVSPGTMKTMIESLSEGTAIRRNGKIEQQEEQTLETRGFDGRKLHVMGIGWGDVSTAFYSTGIPNIRVYMVSKPSQVRVLKVLQSFPKLLGSVPVQQGLKKIVDWGISGPNKTQREKSTYKIWGIVRNGSGKTVELGISTTNGYTFTVDAALASVERVLKGDIAPGVYTPSKAFGSQFVLSLPGIKLLQ